MGTVLRRGTGHATWLRRFRRLAPAISLVRGGALKSVFGAHFAAHAGFCKRDGLA